MLMLMLMTNDAVMSAGSPETPGVACVGRDHAFSDWAAANEFRAWAAANEFRARGHV